VKPYRNRIKQIGMAMNNWGGVKEHMSKKPRKFFENKKVKRDLSSDLKFQLPKEEIMKDEKAKKS